LVFFIVFFNAYRGGRDVDRNIVSNVRMLGVSNAQLTWHVLLPSAMTWILSSLHTSVGFALVGAVVGEYLAAAQGLGWIISQAQGNFDAAGVYAGMLILCIVVVVVEFGVTWLERRLIPWKDVYETMFAYGFWNRAGTGCVFVSLWFLVNVCNRLLLASSTTHDDPRRCRRTDAIHLFTSNTGRPTRLLQR